MVCLCMCSCDCEQDYCSSSRPISLKVGFMVVPTNAKSRLTFVGDPVPDTNSLSLFSRFILAFY